MKALFACLALAPFVLVPSVRAQDTPPPVGQWYEALRAADAEAFDRLIATDARIDLRDLGIVQTREEFIESLDSWQVAMEGATIEAKPLQVSPGSATMDVCYRFPGNEQRNRESFSLADGKIVGVVQEAAEGGCEGF